MNSQIQAAGMLQPIFQSATEAFLGDSETPTPVRVGQLQENVPSLTREEYRKQAAIQKQKDALAEVQAKNPSNPPPTNIPLPKAPAAVRQSGKPSQARRTTSPPVPDTPSGLTFADQIARDQSVLEARIAKMEAGQAQLAKGVDRLVALLAERDERVAAVKTREEIGSSPLGEKGDCPVAQENTSNFDCMLTDDEIAMADASVPDEEDDVLAPDPFEPGDPNIARMQKFIQRKTPLKDFRRFWQGLCPRAGFGEWTTDMQTKFTGLFNTIILHPKFLAQVRRTVLTFRNGQCMGEEQQYKLLVMLAGCCAFYSIVTGTE